MGTSMKTWLPLSAGLAAGIEVAMLTGEIAPVGEVPRDDVGPGEPFDSVRRRPFDSAQRSVARVRRRRVHLDASHAEEVAGRVEDLLVYFEGPSLPGESLDAGPRHRADELGNVREPRFGAGSPPDGDWIPGLAGSRL